MDDFLSGWNGVLQGVVTSAADLYKQKTLSQLNTDGIAYIEGQRAANQAALNYAASSQWMPIVLIGGAVLVVALIVKS
ncbi:MAG: hypothetical protein LBF93_07590 [Zoogloeaceae bacterium]|jgi:hypothetical protein|nr:hypothetical protein [Zoogloeaceae bacterium]